MPGLEVGYVTLISGPDVRTGVTAIHPRGKARPGDPVAAGLHNQNGNGEMTGASWIEESGTFSGPVVITNTHAVGVGHAGIIAWTHQHHPDLTEAWLMPVSAETWDGYLNDINGHHVHESTVVEALENAEGGGPIEEGSVGGGTGMNCYAFKGGSGTASRMVSYAGREYTVGAFVQANFGARHELVLAGVPLGEALADDDPLAEHFSAPPGAGLGHRSRRDRCPSPARPVPGIRPAGDARARPDRDERLPLLRRLVPGLLDSEQGSLHAFDRHLLRVTGAP